MDDGQLPRVPERLERLQPGIESKEAVEIERARRSVRRPGRCDRDARPRAVILLVAERHDHVEAVDRAALKDGDEPLRPRGRARGKRRARQERGRKPEADQRERAVLQEDSSRSHGVLQSEICI